MKSLAVSLPFSFKRFFVFLACLGSLQNVSADGTNLAPDCNSATASPDTLWAPNHSFEVINILGISDPNGDETSLVTQCIVQDESLDDSGDGSTEPDADGLGGDQPRVRIERSGSGDGRVYHLVFKATDSLGASCVGEVQVHIPKDNNDDTAIDSGNRYLSAGFGENCDAVSFNNTPVISSEPVTSGAEGSFFTYQISGHDPDQDDLDYTLLSGPGGMGLDTESGLVTWTPTYEQAGTYEIEVQVSDGELSATQVFTLEIANTNRAPYGADEDLELLENNPLTIILAGTDDDGNPLTAEIISTPAHGALTGSFPNYTYTPDLNFYGEDTFSYQLNDDEAVSEVYEVSFTIESVNDAPVASSGVLNLSEDTSIVIAMTAMDIDSLELSYAVTTPSQHGTLSGDLPNPTYTPDPDYFGEDRLEFVANDGELSSAPAEISLVVEPVNDAPVIVSNPNLDIDPEQDYQYQVIAEDIDDTGLQYALIQAPSGMSIDQDGQIIWPQESFTDGVHTIEVLVSDQESSVSQLFELDLVLERPPVISSQPLAKAFTGEQYIYQVEASDPEGFPLTYSLPTAPEGMSIDPNSGEILWIPTEEQISSMPSGNDGSEPYCGTGECELFYFDAARDGQQLAADLGKINGWDQDWSINQGTASGTSGRISFGTANWSNYIFDSELSFRTLRSGTPIITFFEQANGDRYEFFISDVILTVDRIENGNRYRTTFALSKYIDFGWHAVRVETKNNSARFYVDGEFLFELNDLRWDSGLAGIAYRSYGVNIGSLSVFQPAPQLVIGDSHPVQIEVVDQGGNSAIQEFGLEVFESNGAPTIGGTPTLFATKGVPYHYDALLHDVNFGDEVDLTLVDGPLGMVVNDAAIDWVPDSTGNYNVTLEAVDAYGATSKPQTFTLSVYDETGLLKIGNNPPQKNLEGEIYFHQIELLAEQNQPLLFQLDLGAYNDSFRVDTSSGLIQGELPPEFNASASAQNVFCSSGKNAGDWLDLTNWSEHHGEGEHAGGPGTWYHNREIAELYGNADPAMLVSDFPLEEGIVEITVRTNGNDDDGIGFVWGFQDLEHFYRLRWGKHSNIDYKEIRLINSPEPRYNGGHPTDKILFSGEDNDPWKRFQLYRFVLEVRPGYAYIQFYEEDTPMGEYLIAEEDGFTHEGYFGFYNHSQSDTFYQARLITRGELADLRMGDVTLRQTEGSDVVTVSASNRGTANSPISELKLYARRGSSESYSSLLGTVSVPALSPGQEVTIDFEPVVESLAYDRLYVVVDEVNEIAECHEDNNDKLVSIIQSRVVAKDGQYDYQRFVVGRENVNEAPQIESVPIEYAVVSETYAYLLAVNDPDVGDEHRFELIDGPEGMQVVEESGIVFWAPDIDQLGGQYPVTVRVTDLEGLYQDQTYSIFVHEDPSILSAPVPTARVGQLYQYQVVANDPEGNPIEFSIAGPAGMQISPSGLVTWTPASHQAGENYAVVYVDDGIGGRADQTFEIYVFTEDEINTAPQITSNPLTLSEADSLYLYQIIATDLETDTFVYSLESAPTAMSIDPARGIVTWTPSINDLGEHIVEIEVSDGLGGIDGQTFVLTVRKPGLNNPPEISSTPLVGAILGQTYNYLLDAFDPDGDELTYDLVGAPSGMSIGSDGQITWVPQNSGTYQVSVSVSDGLATVIQTYNLEVVEYADPPRLIGSPPTDAYAGQEYFYVPKARDFTGASAEVSFISGPDGMTFDESTGEIRWTPIEGDCIEELVLEITDQFGQTVEVRFDIVVHSAPKKLNRFQCSLDDASCGLL